MVKPYVLPTSLLTKKEREIEREERDTHGVGKAEARARQVMTAASKAHAGGVVGDCEGYVVVDDETTQDQFRKIEEYRGTPDSTLQSLAHSVHPFSSTPPCHCRYPCCSDCPHAA